MRTTAHYDFTIEMTGARTLNEVTLGVQKELSHFYGDRISDVDVVLLVDYSPHVGSTRVLVRSTLNVEDSTPRCQTATRSGARCTKNVNHIGLHRFELETPTLAEFAEAWKAIPEGVPKRQELADRYGVTLFAIDKRIRQAREQNLLPRPTRGRGHTRESRAN